MICNLTEEQQAIIGHQYQLGSTVVVEARAGTGKTFTLVGLAEELRRRRPGWRGLYLCYNKSVQIEAKTKFPTNIACRTTHSLAWGGYGSEYKHKLGNPRLRDILAVMPEDVRHHTNKWDVCAAAYDALKDFMYGDTAMVTKESFSRRTLRQFSNVSEIADKEDAAQVLVGLCKHLWMLMLKKEKEFPDDMILDMPHDGYLKLFQMDSPELNYDFILFDEAQDANPATLSIVLNQPRLLKVFVGDTHQQIYGFRGSKNALAKISSDKEFLLTKSFRFGNNIAEYAALCLNRFKPYLRRPVKITGIDGECSVGRYNGTYAPVKSGKAVISRTNGTIIINAWSCVLEQIPFTIVGGADSTALIAAETAYMLFRNKDRYDMRDRFIKSFASWGEFVRYAMDSNDNEAKRMVGIVLEYGEQLPRMISSIRASCLPASGPGITTFTTAHKSKGLEWEEVDLADDFVQDSWMHEDKIIDVPEAEANLLYVSITRAKKILSVPPDIHKALSDEPEFEVDTDEDPQQMDSEVIPDGLHPSIMNAILRQ